MTDKEHLYVSTIAQYGSITKAAEILFIAQPSLTQALHRIEAEYGTPFFKRGRDGLRLSDAGAAYLKTAEKISCTYQKMRQELGVSRGAYKDKISLGTIAFQGGVLLPEFLCSYEQKYPNIELKLLEASSDQLEKLLDEGKLDIIMLYRPFFEGAYDYITLYREDFFLAVPQDDADYQTAATAQRPIPYITQEIMRRKKFNMLTANQKSRQVADSICAAAGIVPQIRFSTASFVTAMALTAKGKGVTFVPKSFALYYKDRYPVSYFRFPADWNAGWELVAAYAKNRALSQHCMELIQVMQECIASLPEVFS